MVYAIRTVASICRVRHSRPMMCCLLRRKEPVMSPADLHAFWRRTTETLQQTPLQAKLTEAPEQSGREYVTSLVQLDSFEAKRLRAWYTLPKDTAPGGGL